MEHALSFLAFVYFFAAGAVGLGYMAVGEERGHWLRQDLKILWWALAFLVVGTLFLLAGGWVGGTGGVL